MSESKKRIVKAYEIKCYSAEKRKVCSHQTKTEMKKINHHLSETMRETADTSTKSTLLSYDTHIDELMVMMR